MTAHRKISKLLYDYATGTLPPEDRRSVEEHLSCCDKCRRDKIAIEKASGYLSTAKPHTDDAFDAAYWNKLAVSIMQNPVTQHTHHHKFTISRAAYIGASAVVIFLLILTFIYYFHDGVSTERHTDNIIESPDPVSEEYAAFIERSKMLLTGFMNAGPYNGHIDISVERTVARELADNTRQLLVYRFDEHTSDLIHELQIIYREIANMADEDTNEKLFFLQSMIQERNLLFRIRMEEIIIQNDLEIFAGYVYPGD